jgi:membrane-associated phospholipid phosphatase
MIPDGQAGTYTALFFSTRAVAMTVALPVAGGLIALTGSYRALFVLGGLAGLAALVPLTWGLLRKPLSGWGATWLAGVGGLFLAVLALGKAVAVTPLHEIDERLFEVVNGLGPGPDLLWTLLDPHTRNYAILIGVGIVLGASSGLARSGIIAILQLASAVLAWGLLESVYALYDRPRPEEALGRVVGGGGWAHIESYPSGHLAITTALAVALALAFPRLRHVLIAYVAVVAATRILFGAHFPLDTLAGAAVGAGSAFATRSLFGQVGLAINRISIPKSRTIAIAGEAE